MVVLRYRFVTYCFHSIGVSISLFIAIGESIYICVTHLATFFSLKSIIFPPIFQKWKFKNNHVFVNHATVLGHVFLLADVSFIRNASMVTLALRRVRAIRHVTLILQLFLILTIILSTTKSILSTILTYPCLKRNRQFRHRRLLKNLKNVVFA